MESYRNINDLHRAFRQQREHDLRNEHANTAPRVQTNQPTSRPRTLPLPPSPQTRTTRARSGQTNQTTSRQHTRQRVSSSQIATTATTPESHLLNDRKLEIIIVHVMRDTATNIADVINHLRPERRNDVTARQVTEAYDKAMSTAADYWYGERNLPKEKETEKKVLRDFNRNLQTISRV